MYRLVLASEEFLLGESHHSGRVTVRSPCQNPMQTGGAQQAIEAG